MTRTAPEILSDLAAVASDVARLEARRAHLHTELAGALAAAPARPAEAPPRYLTTDEAALHLGVSRSHLERLRANGTGPAYVRIGTSVRYRFDGLVVGAYSAQGPRTHADP